MILLNVGAGGTLPGSPWVNIDYPHEHTEMTNYIRHDASTRLPFDDGTVDGLAACHFLEHFDCLTAVEILKDFRRVLRKDGVCRIVVPDARYFRKTHSESTANPQGSAMRLYGEPLNANQGGHPHYMAWALFWSEHRQLLTEDSLWCELVQAGFSPDRIYVADHQKTGELGHPCSEQVAQLDNRPLFSLRMEAMK